MGNAAAFDALDKMIARVRSIPELVREAAPEVASEVQRELTANIAAGVSPDGKALLPTKTGKRPLSGAAKALSVRAVGTVVIVTLEGPEAKHHLGIAKGHVKRRLIPTRGMSDPMKAAIRKVFARKFHDHMRGAGE